MFYCGVGSCPPHVGASVGASKGEGSRQFPDMFSRQRCAGNNTSTMYESQEEKRKVLGLKADDLLACIMYGALAISKRQRAAVS
jgi:hypothetical protein